MTTRLRLARKTALLFASLLPAIPLGAEEASFRMPEYGEASPPAAVAAGVVEALHAGADSEALAADLAGDTLKVLLVSGEKDHGPGEHDYPAWREVWARLLDEAPGTEVDVAYTFPTGEQLAWADVAVFYQRGRWDDERAEAIDQFLARGGGLVYLHWAVDGRGGEAAMAQRIGLAAKGGGGIRYRHGAMDVDFAPGGGHPITRNLQRALWYDEAYWRLTGDPARLNLLGVSVEDDAPQPQFWTMDSGSGRVFVSIPGHFAWTFDDPVFRTVILRGIAWAGGRCVDRFNNLATLDARIAEPQPHDVSH
ncbi:Trehalose utilization [Botrimarina colliarenosi]|uniref:Trehalose utilization n=1 Tax=Botrimarina colliarenosi TaxID=2528001 RepID=A0A5C6AEV6_9BACT|nr:ThuA domain-containing protein [Botrimarina colliarenosi]TWT97715.1 Trehalose utilization [Botrimarina colliarenosi]